MILFFARHGESEANVLNIFSNTGSKHGLTEKGVAQSASLAERMADEQITRIYASPLLRAQQTATIVAERIGIPVVTDAALREFSVGTFEGKANDAGWEEYRDVERRWLVDGEHSARVGGGECFTEIADRFLPFVRGLCQIFQATDERLLVISHGGLLVCMLPLIVANISREFAESHPLAQTGVVRTEWRGDGLYGIEWAGVPVG